jgi:hypothetical protein
MSSLDRLWNYDIGVAMNYWIFTVAPYKSGSEYYSARQIYERRMEDRFWGLGARTAHRKNVREGDQVVFYVGRPDCAFGGTARLASDSVTLTAEQQSDLSHSSVFFTAEYGVFLDAVEIWGLMHPMPVLAPSLKFIKNPGQWGVYLQGGIRQVTEADYAAIVNGTISANPKAERLMKSRRKISSPWRRTLRNSSPTIGHGFPGARAWNSTETANKRDDNSPPAHGASTS